jgi:hypothetical protein
MLTNKRKKDMKRKGGKQMKKFSVLVIAALMAFMFAAPAMATDVSFGGTYRAQGAFDSNRALADDEETSCSYMDMRLRLQTMFKVTDALSLTTRFDALDRQWGSTDDDAISSVTTTDATTGAVSTTSTADSDNNIDFDRAYMTIKTGLGKFVVGRQAGGTFGLDFADSETERDRIKYVLPLDNFTLVGIIEKLVEGDANTDVNDEDKDAYYLAGIYKGETATLGGLVVFINGKNSGGSANAILVIPYATAKFGRLGVNWELDYLLGEASDVNDYNAFGTMLEGTYDFASVPANAELGIVYLSGDDGTDTDVETFPYGTGDDWGTSDNGGDDLNKLFLMTGSYIGHENVGETTFLDGNFSYSGGNKSSGLMLIYTGGGYNLNDDMRLSGVLGYGMRAEDNYTVLEDINGDGVDDALTLNFDDSLGIELDIQLDWKLMDNLTYQAVAAYLAAGDGWRPSDATSGGVAISEATLNAAGIETETGGDFALFHRLQLSF